MKKLLNKTMKSVAEKAKELGISRQAVLQQIKKGKISAIRIGRSWVVIEKK